MTGITLIVVVTLNFNVNYKHNKRIKHFILKWELFLKDKIPSEYALEHSLNNSNSNKRKTNEYNLTLNKNNSKPSVLLKERSENHVNSQIHVFLNTPYMSQKKDHQLRWLHNTNESHSHDLIINKPNLCGPNHGSSVLLLVLVVTSPLNVDARKAIRDTWGKDLKTKGAKLAFLLGIPKTKSLQRKLQEEDFIYKDLIQGNFLDTYLNLSTKTLVLIRWASLYCPLVKFILKSDDDVFINSKTLLQVINTRNDSHTLLGLLAHKWSPHRNKNSKWYVPPEIYPQDYYPDFIAGPAYLITGDSTALLYAAREETPHIYLEDVYVTGLLAEKAGVRRLGLSGMSNDRQFFTNISSLMLINSHGHNPQSLRNLWKWFNLLDKKRIFNKHLM
ncbi:beta-1,3-galactosyltransferase 1-like [Limulus polyphemus]|uniref:Hexosyltransferase n=1 Tax=Limulus polyphemus TaxID=6850 RepID=A0ABM1BDT6_LIMPO|nr:beta-1,3-galactosyltransferase 1-like [Limulus polyphemus]